MRRWPICRNSKICSRTSSRFSAGRNRTGAAPCKLLVTVFVRVMFRGFLGVMLGVQMMAVRYMRIMAGLFVIP